MNIPNPSLLTADGDYDIKVRPGGAYLLLLKNTFGGATVTLKTLSTVVAATYDNVIGGAFTDVTEQDVRPPSKILRLTVSGATGATSIRVTLVQHSN